MPSCPGYLILKFTHAPQREPRTPSFLEIPSACAMALLALVASKETISTSCGRRPSSALADRNGGVDLPPNSGSSGAIACGSRPSVSTDYHVEALALRLVAGRHWATRGGVGNPLLALDESFAADALRSNMVRLLDGARCAKVVRRPATSTFFAWS